MPSFDTLVLQLLMVLLVGGVIGAERELRSKSAGFRTMILICLGSYLFTTFSFTIGDTSDRIASNIVTGIGFLGAGVIFKEENRVNGITTAATIWVIAALGMGIANEKYTLVFMGTGLMLVALFFLTALESLMDKVNQSKTYRIVRPYREELLYQYEEMFVECELRFKRIRQTRQGADITGSWLVHGKEKNHRRFVEKILHDNSVKEFEF